MADEIVRQVRLILETLIKAENEGGQSAHDIAASHLADAFVITRAPRRLEQSKGEYLNGLVNAGASNPLRWLDLAEADQDLVEPSRKDTPFPGSCIQIRGDTVIARAIVTTRARARDAADQKTTRYRNIFVLVRPEDRWLVWLWQTAEVQETELRPWPGG